MRKLIVKSLEAIAYVAIVLIVIGSGVGGASTMGGFTGFIVGLSGGAVFSIVTFGALFLLIDIAENTRRTARGLDGGSRRSDPGTV